MKSPLPILGLALLFACGCESEKDVSTNAILGDLSPEMLGLVETPARARANSDITEDFNSRMFYDDLGRALYTDQPSRLTPYPMGSPSGIPR